MSILLVPQGDRDHYRPLSNCFTMCTIHSTHQTPKSYIVSHNATIEDLILSLFPLFRLIFSFFSPLVSSFSSLPKLPES